MASTIGPIQVFSRLDTIPTDEQGGYAGGASTAAALITADARSGAAMETINALDVTATTLPAGSPATATISGPALAKRINFAIPRGADGMGYAEGQQLLADSQQAVNDSTALVGDYGNLVTLAQQAQAATLEVPDANTAAMIGNPATETRAALNEAASQIEATGGDQTARLDAWLARPSALGVKKLVGDFEISGALTVPTGSVVDGRAATITQTSDLTAGLRIVNSTDIHIDGLTLNGVTTDYVDASSVYNAAAVTIAGASQDIRITNCQMLGWAGAGVNISSATTGAVSVRGCTMTGAKDEIAAERAAAGPTAEVNYGAGVRCLSVEPLEISGCDISEFAQGITTAKNQADIRIVGNHIHDITSGQHGAYLSMVAGRLVFTDNIITGCFNCGMKVQIAAPITGPESGDIIISDNVITHTGSQAIMVTNIATSPPDSLVATRRFAIVGNVVTDNGRGIQINDADNGIIALNVISDSLPGTQGILLEDSTNLTVVDNRLDRVPFAGIRITNLTSSRIERNTLVNPATSGTASNNFGIHVSGVCGDLTFVGNRVTDTLGQCLYGLWLNPSSGLETFTVRDNYVSVTGANSYGARFGAAGPIRHYEGNDFNGATGRVVGEPTEGLGYRGSRSFGAAIPTSQRHERGDIRWNTTPTVGGWIGWVCVTAGTPGQWRGFGAIDSP